MKRLLFLGVLFLVPALFFLHPRQESTLLKSKPEILHPASTKNAAFLKLKTKAGAAGSYLKQAGFSTHYLFLIDMSLPGGQARFFIYDRKKDSVVHAGLVAHGSCRTGYLAEPRFSNQPDCGCSSLGKYKIGYAYNGRFGKAFKLFGLDSSNSNAFKRAIVLHAYDCVPDSESSAPLCNSLGCPMVSYTFFDVAARIIEASEKPVLLWIYK